MRHVCHDCRNVCGVVFYVHVVNFLSIQKRLNCVIVVISFDDICIGHVVSGV